MQRQCINLTFHGIGTPGHDLAPGERDVWVSELRLLSVLDAVAGRDDVRVTFDDGNLSDLAIALPALQARDMSAIFFVIADRLDKDGYLAAADLRTLADAGMTIGSHGLRHRPWRACDTVALEEELVDARRLLEDALGGRITVAACPFGSYGRRALRALGRAGYERVYTSDRGPARPSDWLQARTTLTEHGALDLILTPDRSPYAALRRRAKLTAKRWR